MTAMRRTGGRRGRLQIQLAFACALLVWVTAAFSRAPQEYALDIARQPLSSALVVFGQQTGLQIGIGKRDDDAAHGVSVVPLKGRYTAEDALQTLLAGSGLEFKWLNERAIFVAAVVAPEPSAYTLEYVIVTAPPLRDLFFVHEVAVLGSTTIAEPGRLDELGVETVADLLKFISQQPYARSDAFSRDGAQHVELRGLGPNTALILINGRRTAPTSTSIALDAFDLNTIPVAAVERVEILSDSISVAYGADAIGGVVNLRLRNDIPAATIDASIGGSRGGANERSLSFSAGDSGERWRGSVVLDYFDRDSLLGAERERWGNQDYRRFGGFDFRSLQSNPGNVSSLTPENLPGLAASFAAVPEGSGGIRSSDDFVATVGERNLASQLRDYSIVPSAQQESVVAVGEMQVTPNGTAFGELLYSRREAISQFGPATFTEVVPATNAFNPFGVAVRVDYQFAGIAPRQQVTTARLLRAVAGMRGDWRGWDWELSLLRSDDDGATRRENEIDPTRLHAALASSDPDQALNVFQDGPGAGRALLASLAAPPSIIRYESQMTQLSGLARGPLLTMPAGAVTGAFGIEQRTESVLVDDQSLQTSMAHERDVLGVFGELHAPLVAPAQRLPGLNELSLVAGARLDRHEYVGSLINSQLAMIWRPAAEVALRAAYGTSFRPPSSFELFGPRYQVITLVRDRRRGEEIAEVTLQSGGNPDLEGTRARSVSAGAVFTPRSNDVRIAATYWRTRVEGRVLKLPATALLAEEELYPDRVLRAARSAADVAAGLPGPLRLVDVSPDDLGELRMQGIDFEASHSFETRLGRFSPRLLATWVKEFQAAELSGAPPTQQVGVASAFGTIPRWRAIATLAWQRDLLSLETTARYVSPYDDVELIARTGRIVSSQTLIDVRLSFDLDVFSTETLLLQGVTATAGALNIFDREPPFSAVNAAAGYDASQGDLRQRFIYLKLSKKF